MTEQPAYAREVPQRAGILRLSAHRIGNRCVIAVLLALVAIALSAAPAAAQTPPGTRGEFTSSPAQVRPGDAIAVSGVCLFGSQPAQMFVGASKLQNPGPDVYAFNVRLKAAPDGSVRGSLTVPTDAPAGEYRMSGSCEMEDAVFFTGGAPLTVLPGIAPTSTVDTTPAEPPPTIRREPLARTGADLSFLLGVAALLAAAGVATTTAASRIAGRGQGAARNLRRPSG